MMAQELRTCFRTSSSAQHLPSHHAGDEGNEGDESHEGHEEGYEAPRDEGCRGGCTSDEGDESHEGYEGNEGYEEGHEAQGNEEGRRGGRTSDEGDESHEGDEGHEGYEEGNEGHEGNESHEGDEEVSGWKRMSLLLVGSGREQCERLELWRGSSPGSPVQTWGASHL